MEFMKTEEDVRPSLQSRVLAAVGVVSIGVLVMIAGAFALHGAIHAPLENDITTVPQSAAVLTLGFIGICLVLFGMALAIRTCALLIDGWND